MNAITRSELNAVDAPVIDFTLNGRAVSAHANETLIQVAQREGIDVPRLCYKEGLEAVRTARSGPGPFVDRNWSARILPNRRSSSVRASARGNPGNPATGAKYASLPSSRAFWITRDASAARASDDSGASPRAINSRCAIAAARWSTVVR